MRPIFRWDDVIFGKIGVNYLNKGLVKWFTYPSFFHWFYTPLRSLYENKYTTQSQTKFQAWHVIFWNLRQLTYFFYIIPKSTLSNITFTFQRLESHIDFLKKSYNLFYSNDILPIFLYYRFIYLCISWGHWRLKPTQPWNFFTLSLSFIVTFPILLYNISPLLL